MQASLSEVEAVLWRLPRTSTTKRAAAKDNSGRESNAHCTCRGAAENKATSERAADRTLAVLGCPKRSSARTLPPHTLHRRPGRYARRQRSVSIAIHEGASECTGPSGDTESRCGVCRPAARSIAVVEHPAMPRSADTRKGHSRVQTAQVRQGEINDRIGRSIQGRGGCHDRLVRLQHRRARSSTEEIVACHTVEMSARGREDEQRGRMQSWGESVYVTMLV